MLTEASVEVQGRLGIGDLARYQYYHSLRRWWPLVILIAVVALGAMTALPIILMDDSSDWRAIIINAVPFIMLMFFWLGLIIFLPYRNAKKQYAAQGYLREALSLSFTQQGIAYRSDSVSSSMVWATVREVRETKNLFLIYHAPNIAFVIPKRFFSTEGTMAQWRQLVVSATGKATLGGGFVGRWC